MNHIELKKEPKKSAIVCYGTRISLNSINVRSVDLTFMRSYLMDVLGRSEVDYVSQKTKKEEGLDYFKDITDVDLNYYDEVFIYNCTLNPFGGVFKWHSLQLFVDLYNYNGKIYYALFDPKMPAVDFAKYLKNRDKNGTYTFKADNEAGEFKIDPEILDNWTEKVWSRMNTAYAGLDYDKFVELWNKKHKGKITELNTEIEWTNFWLFEYYSVNEEFDLKMKDYEKVAEPYDLVYFGNNRQNERNKVIKKLYDIPEFKKYCIGFDPELQNCEFEKYLKHEKLFEKLGKNCLATVVVGDDLHNGNFRTARFFETMLLDIAAFIYIDFDPTKQYMNDPFLKEFIYVSSKEELKEKILMLKNDHTLYRKVVELERKEIITQFGNYKNEAK
jgi:hypothetical protein